MTEIATLSKEYQGSRKAVRLGVPELGTTDKNNSEVDSLHRLPIAPRQRLICTSTTEVAYVSKTL